MYIHKWELRYPLLLLLMLLMCGVRQIRADATCNSADAKNPECQKGRGFLWETNDDGTCRSSECFGNDTADTYETFRTGEQLTPVLTREGVYAVGETQTFHCRAWVNGPSSTTGLVGMQIFISNKPKEAAKLKTSKRYSFIDNATVESVVVEAVLSLVLRDELHGHNISCRMIFRGVDNINDEVKKRQGLSQLYAFYEASPLIRGPKEVEVGRIYTWDCVTETVTVDEQSQFTVKTFTNPTPPSSPVVSDKFQILSNGGTPLKAKVTTSLKFPIPPNFRPAFFVHCRTANTVLGPGRQVIKIADIMRVAVITKPHDLSGIFTIVGVSSGLGGFALGMALVVFYCRKKSSAGAEKSISKS